MYITQAARHAQPRPNRPERCEHCMGVKLALPDATPGTVELDGQTVPFVSDAPDKSVIAFNMLIPGIGNDRTHLHPECADHLRDDN